MVNNHRALCESEDLVFMIFNDDHLDDLNIEYIRKQLEQLFHRLPDLFLRIGMDMDEDHELFIAMIQRRRKNLEYNIYLGRRFAYWLD